MSGHILDRQHGFQVDHVGLGVPDTEAGVRWLEAKTGAKVMLTAPEPDQWFWSGSLPIAEDSFLEVIGPNPAWTKFHPFRALLSTLREPQLLFWYVAVDNFDVFKDAAKRAGGALENIERVNIDAADPAHSGYVRGLVGPGFLTQRPNVIEWTHKSDDMAALMPECRLIRFHLTHPDADTITPVFDKLGIDITVSKGPSRIGLSLETPKGRVDFENPGISLRGLASLVTIAKLWWQTR